MPPKIRLSLVNPYCIARFFLRRDTILNSRHVWRIILVAKVLVRIRIDERLQSIP